MVYLLNVNDDGVTLSSSYRDPRNNVSPWRTYHDLNPHGARCVTVEHSYFSSGGGKAIAVIPWGSTNPEPQNQIIDSVKVTDCILAGGYSVGTWPDNPFDGKPFTNTETDDFSTVQNFWVFNNDYLNEWSLASVAPSSDRLAGERCRSSSSFYTGRASAGNISTRGRFSLACSKTGRSRNAH